MSDMTLKFPATGLTFANVWTTATAHHQRSLIDSMKAEVNTLTSQPGFQSMAFLRSGDGLQVIVLAQWESIEAFETAVSNNADALESRRALEAHGQSSAHEHVVDSIYGPSPAA